MVAVVGAVSVVGARFARHLRGRHRSPALPRAPDRVLFTGTAGAYLAVAPAVVLGVPAWLAASAEALPVVLLFARRRRDHLRWRLVPWRLVVLTLGLFLSSRPPGGTGWTTC